MEEKRPCFEKDFYAKLSLWWTQHWPSPSQTVFSLGAHRTVAARDPQGVPLTSTVSIEVRKGYYKRTVADLLDFYENSIDVYEEWFRSAYEKQRVQKTFGWMIAARREHRDPVVFLSQRLADRVEGMAHPKVFSPRLTLQTDTHWKASVNGQVPECVVVVTTLSSWLFSVTPEHIRRLYQFHTRPQEKDHDHCWPGTTHQESDDGGVCWQDM